MFHMLAGFKISRVIVVGKHTRLGPIWSGFSFLILKFLKFKTYLEF